MGSGDAVKRRRTARLSAFNGLSVACRKMMVPRERLELSRCYQRRILNPLRLPIPPSRHSGGAV